MFYSSFETILSEWHGWCADTIIFINSPEVFVTPENLLIMDRGRSTLAT